MIEFSRIREGDKVTVPFTVKRVDASDQTILIESGIGSGWFGAGRLATHEAKEIVVGDMAKTSHGVVKVIAIHGDRYWCDSDKDGPLTYRRELLERA